MKSLINIIIFTALIYTLRTVDIYADNWQFWAVMACVFAFGMVEVVGSLWKEAD